MRLQTDLQALLLDPGPQAVHVPGGDLHVGLAVVGGDSHVGGVLVQDGGLRLLSLLGLFRGRCGKGQTLTSHSGMYFNILLIQLFSMIQ